MATRPPASPSKARAPRATGGRLRIRAVSTRRWWTQRLLLFVGLPCVLGLGVAVYFWVSYARIIDRKLGGDERPVPHIFGRPFELRAGQPLSPTLLVQRLNDVGYDPRIGWLLRQSVPGRHQQTGGAG